MTWALHIRKMLYDPDCDRVPGSSTLSKRKGSPVKSTVLVIDDDPDTCDSLATVLEVEGFTVATARNGAQALSLATALRPAAVLLDLGLPDGHGAQLIRELRSAPWGPNTRIAVISGWCEPKHRRFARAAGCDRFFPKPASPHEIIAFLTEPLADPAA
jgi:DNA-binding response OmpR family regulator